jgi:excisionase family DNA binding protein
MITRTKSKRSLRHCTIGTERVSQMDKSLRALTQAAALTFRSQPSPWLTVAEAAEWARCGVKLIYREVAAKRLRAARVGGRLELRLLRDWVDEWLTKRTTIQ